MAVQTSNYYDRLYGLWDLQEQGYISELNSKVNTTLRRYSWSFRMGMILFHHNGQETQRDFSKYRLRILYRPQKKGRQRIKVLIDEPIIQRKKHFWPDNSLCLYKPTNFQWKVGMKISTNLFPSICTWLYHYEVWLETGHWYGEEAEH